ncbi:hypothetical protein [Psychromicrobium sp. YIM B11713]|uniref:hypothetical protein n=1 Tax=Psychromicrobium sp. YIM B11713 TaxID=3145233 RepID=UPI00374E717D
MTTIADFKVLNQRLVEEIKQLRSWTTAAEAKISLPKADPQCLTVLSLSRTYNRRSTGDMSWPKKNSTQIRSPHEDQQKKPLSTAVIVEIILAAVVMIGVGLWLMAG